MIKHKILLPICLKAMLGRKKRKKKTKVSKWFQRFQGFCVTSKHNNIFMSTTRLSEIVAVA